MKKWGYLLSGVIIGAMLMTSGSALAAQVKSLVGQKVTGEYTVIVNGKTLSDKGAVIDGKTNAPVRAISDAIGSKLDVDNKKKVIKIITETNDNQGSNTSIESTMNKYTGQSKEALENKKVNLTSLIKSSEEAKANDVIGLDAAKKSQEKAKENPNFMAPDEEYITKLSEQIKTYDADIARYTEELRLINEALNLLNK